MTAPDSSPQTSAPPSSRAKHGRLKFVVAAVAAAALAAAALSIFGTPPPAEAQAETTFTTTFQVRVPFINNGGDENALQRNTIEVTYRPVANSQPGCQQRTETFTIIIHGTDLTGGLAENSGARTRLVNTPTGSSTPCEYTADFADSFTDATHGDYPIQSGDNQRVSASSRGGRVAFDKGSVFFPDIDIAVIRVNADADDPLSQNVDDSTRNLFWGYTFRATVAATGGPVASCTGGGNDLFAIHSVADNGEVWINREGPHLIGVPTGETDKCVYTVTFPATAVARSLVTNPLTLNRVSGQTASEIDIDFPYAFREYRQPTVTDLRADIFLSASAEDTVWEFRVAPAAGAPDHCTPAHRWRHAAGADMQVQTDTPLVRRPIGARSDCSYTLTWPTNEVGGTTYSRVAAEAAMTTVTLTHNAEVSASYEGAEPPMPTPFTPALEVTVPTLDGTTSGTNIWSGEQLDVTIARANGADANCSLASPAEVTYTVDATGATSTTDADLPTELTGTTAAGIACDYTVTFGPAPTAAANPNSFDWTMTVPPVATLTSSSTLAAGVYTVGAVTFDPDVDITVPSGHAPKQLSASFASSVSGCDDQTLTFTIQPDDTVDPDSANPSLVAYPATATTSNDACSYTVTFAMNEVGGGNTLVVQARSSTTATHQSSTLTAEYRAAAGGTPPQQTATMFEPNIRVRVPFIDPNDHSANDLVGSTVTATYRPVTSPPQHADCTADAPPETFTIEEEGTTYSGSLAVPSASRTQLVNVPLGQTASCVYAVDFDDSFAHATHGDIAIERGDGASFNAAGSVNADGSVNTGEPVLVAYSNDTLFFPDVIVSVPQINDATDDTATANVDERTLNLFRGAIMRVTILPTAESPAGCTALLPNGSAGFRVLNDGSVSHSPRGLMLIDVPSGATASCAYTVTLPPEAIVPSNARETYTLRRVFVKTTETIDADYPYAFREYRRPEATKMQADIFINDSDVGTLWEFAVAPAPGAPDHCTPAHRWRAEAGAGQDGRQVQTSTGLIHRPVGAGADCSYTLTWPTSEVDGNRYERVAGELATATLTNFSEVTANYDLAVQPSTFSPSVTVVVPFVDENDDGTNDLSDQLITVRYRPVAGSHSGCAQRSDIFNVSYAADATNARQGTVTQTGTPVSLVDSPVGVTSRCSYTADATDAITPAGSGATVDIAAGSDNQPVSATSGAITISYGDAAPTVPQTPPPPPPPPSTSGGSGGRPTGGGSGRPGGSGGGSSGGTATGPFVPSATQRVPVGVTLTLPADRFSTPTPIEVLVHAPGECGTDVRTFDGLPASIGVTYALDAAVSGTDGATAEVIAAGARQLAQLAERGAQQRPCALRVTLLTAPTGCTFAGSTTDDAGRSYVELTWSEGAAALNVAPALVCTDPT